MQAQSLLAVFAHPDDESFTTGGALAHYSTSGVHVALVCATRGDVGEIADPSLATPETLSAVREAELRCAAEALHVSELFVLGYRGSGMAGTPANDDPGAFANVPADEVVARLVGIIRRLRPEVVITFDPNGGYGHPDHLAAHHHTVAAFHAAGDPASYPEEGQPWQPSRLFYSVLPRAFFAQLRDEFAAAGLDTGEFDRFEESGPFWPDDQVHVTLDVAGHVDAKWAALHCHRTQFGPQHFFRRVSEEVMKQMIGREHFALAWPPPSPGLRLPDLFARLETA